MALENCNARDKTVNETRVTSATDRAVTTVVYCAMVRRFVPVVSVPGVEGKLVCGMSGVVPGMNHCRFNTTRRPGSEDLIAVLGITA